MHSRHEAKGEKQPIRYPFSQLIQVPSVSVSDVREAMEVDAPVEGGVSSKTFKWLLMPTGAILA